MRVPIVPIATIKLRLSSISIEGASSNMARKKNPRPFQTWDDLYPIHQSFLPLLRRTNLRMSITRFQNRWILFGTKMPLECLKIIEESPKFVKTELKAVVAKTRDQASAPAPAPALSKQLS
ncbi:hypothetical protein Tco_0727743 [Tanacetum coccineum]|uniref:Uncharacterized protein n=1 Tax=Tanacetum coccineum TaxID=301880 RepID=A0ABQ4YLS9_9ASTR